MIACFALIADESFGVSIPMWSLNWYMVLIILVVYSWQNNWVQYILIHFLIGSFSDACISFLTSNNIYPKIYKSLTCLSPVPSQIFATANLVVLQMLLSNPSCHWLMSEILAHLAETTKLLNHHLKLEVIEIWFPIRNLFSSRPTCTQVGVQIIH